MRILRILFFVALFSLPAAVAAALSADDLPAETKWYFHADFDEMRSNDAGSLLFGWLSDEVFDDIRDETGVDLENEADFLTAFAADDGGMVIVIEGDISQDTQDKILAMASTTGNLDRFGSGKGAFYHVEDDEDSGVRVADGNDNIDIDVDSFDNGAYFSFAVDKKLIVTSTRETMESLLANRGKVPGVRATRGQLFVLTAERNLVQAGARTTDFGGNGNWDSNILRNTEQAALLVAEKSGKIAIEVELVTTEPEMAESLASIVRGLISLQAFNSEMDPEIAAFLQNTRVDVKGTRLSINVALDPETVVAAIE